MYADGADEGARETDRDQYERQHRTPRESGNREGRSAGDRPEQRYFLTEALMLRFLTIMAALVVMVAAPAYALDLDGARKAGLVGEKLDGYVAVVKPAAEVEALVTEI